MNKNVVDKLDFYAEEFQSALPYRHVCIENFFESEVAEGILRDFPAFGSANKSNEFGVDGQKAVFENLSEISFFYSELTKYLKSCDFATLISRISGIPDLRWGGLNMYGGGTHENIDGAELDAHVDFNYDDTTREHRRLNLLVYLNKEWGDDWGGEFELHSNPRDSKANRIKSYKPMFNRAVLMETNELSWHGFPRISLPAEKKHLSRKSLALYFYTKDRPSEEIKGGHATFYIQRPLPETFVVGATVTKPMFDEITYLVSKRDAFLKLHQQAEVVASERYTRLRDYHDATLAGLRAPVIGYARQIGSIEGLYPDDWISDHFRGVFGYLRDVGLVTLSVYVPAHQKLPCKLSFAVDSLHTECVVEREGIYDLQVRIDGHKGDEVTLSFSTTTTTSGLEAGINLDERQVSALLSGINFSQATGKKTLSYE